MTRLITIFGNSGVIPTVQGWELRTLLRGSANQNAGNIKTCRRHTIQCIKVTFGALGATSETIHWKAVEQYFTVVLFVNPLTPRVKP